MRKLHMQIGFMRLAMAPIMVMLLFMAGCATPAPTPTKISDVDGAAAPVLSIEPGDQLTIDFFGAPDLNTTQTVRLDGRISLKLVGDLKCSGMTPEELQATLLALYASQLQAKSITVTIVSRLPIYVSGAVLQPGKFDLLRPTTAIEAIMEAGGFIQGRSDARGVVVIRHENGVRRGFVLDYSEALAGASGAAFYLRAGDIVHVPTTTPWIQSGKK